MNLALLAYEMRVAGIKSLALELADEPGPPPIADTERPAAASGALPADDLPPKQPDECVATGCTAKRGGLFGGVAGEYCRAHALQKAGVKAT